jgi:hypothetical protein
VTLAQEYDGSAINESGLPANLSQDWALAQSLVPEPTTALAGFVSLAVFARRRLR